MIRSLAYFSRQVLLLAVLFTSTIVDAQGITSTLPYGSRVTTQIESLSVPDPKQTLGNNQQLFPPASTLKLVTALAAKLTLPKDFSFATELYQHQDDLIVRFSGDPLLRREHLNYLLTQAKAQGITTIEGDIWLDNSVFDGYERAVGWPWDILGVCYSAPSSAISLDKNCIQASIYTNQNGSTRVFVPQHQPIIATTRATTVSTQVQQETHCTLELTPDDNNHYHLDGCLVARDKPLPLRFAVQNTAQYVSLVLEQLLIQHNIAFKGHIRVGAKPDFQYGQPLAQHTSVELDQLLAKMLKSSNNLIADNLTKTLGHTIYKTAGTFTNGTEAIKQVVFEHSGIDLSHARLADGSGLSRNNLLTSEDMAKVLRYIWQQEESLGLIGLMPTAGESGTLQYRRSMRKAPVKGNIIAKSGSVYGTYNMAGFGLDQQGKPQTLFVQFVADYHPMKKRDGIATIAPITLFETEFYQQVVEFSQAMPKK
ncbi:serine-type D-Ala-D-Ala carboxypeptidase [Vibrio sp. WXL210]|uniref:serine-type D-Ala-D-Ala carboxypeptidase n=1 Tax=Vibrio sp. WXL210 TaxID=3450709 RepID=UPI003EC6486F